jgi:GTP-binding protein
VKPVDAEMMKMLDEAAVSYRLVLTKADKIKASELAAVHRRDRGEARKHVAAYPGNPRHLGGKGHGHRRIARRVVADATT